MATEKDDFLRGLELRMAMTAGVSSFAEHFRVIRPNAPLRIATDATPPPGTWNVYATARRA